MKAPSRDIAVSLQGQASPGRGDEAIGVTDLAQSGPSLTVPGDGDVHAAPGDSGQRSAAYYAYPMARFGGRGSTGQGAVAPAPRERRQFNRFRGGER